MKKKGILFACYCLAIIIVIVIFLVIRFTSKDSDSNNPSKPPVNDTYAQSLTLNCPKIITMDVDSKIRLKDNYISVDPISKINDIKHKLTNSTGRVTDAIVFDNNIITANEEGLYYITFSVASSSKANIVVQLTVNVIAKGSVLECTSDTLIMDEEYDIADIFAIKDPNLHIDVTNTDSSILKYENRQFIGLKAGSTKVDITLHTEYVDYMYTYRLYIKRKPSYSIDIDGDDNAVTNLKRYTIYYHVLDLDAGDVSQDVSVIISDDSIAKINLVMSPTIQIEFLSKGNVTVVITSLLDRTVSKSIIITYE